MYFQYDNAGTPFGFVYNGTQYFYVTNQMNDVVGIIDIDGKLIAKYLYDDWGKLISIDTTDEENVSVNLDVANANPLRYRGYYYDSETGYYYLQSRYYDADICRFINADTFEIPVITKDLTYDINLYNYCSNNPINLEDRLGLFGPAIALPYFGWLALGAIAILAFVYIILWAVTSAIENAPAISAPSFSYAKPAEKADEKIKDTIKRPQGYKYWLANRNDSYVSISMPLSYETALTFVIVGMDIFAINSGYALNLALAASIPGEIPYGPEITKGKENVVGYYWHYHPNPRTGSHIFFI